MGPAGPRGRRKKRLRVAAQFDRLGFSCARCDEDARRGGDLRFSNSGKAGSCDGPREWRWFPRHPSGGFTWKGCPRTSVTPEVEAWISLYDRCDGKLSFSEVQETPMLILEVFDTLDQVRALQRWEAAENARLAAERPVKLGRHR